MAGATVCVLLGVYLSYRRYKQIEVAKKVGILTNTSVPVHSAVRDERGDSDASASSVDSEVARRKKKIEKRSKRKVKKRSLPPMQGAYAGRMFSSPSSSASVAQHSNDEFEHSSQYSVPSFLPGSDSSSGGSVRSAQGSVCDDHSSADDRPSENRHSKLSSPLHGASIHSASVHSMGDSEFDAIIADMLLSSSSDYTSSDGE